MAPVKNKKKKSITTESTSKQVDSDKKPLKKGRKNGNADESTSAQVDSNKKIVEEEKVGDAEESVPAPKVKKPCTWLKLDRLDTQIGSKSLLQNCKQEKESKSVSQVQTEQDNKRKRTRGGEEKGNKDSVRDQNRIVKHRQDKDKRFVGNRHEEMTKDNKAKRMEERQETSNHDGKHISRHLHEKDKRFVNNRHEGTTKESEESGKLGGLIFMCNAKTKPDCFKFQVLGIPANKKEVVMSIKPGLKLFLYDYDLKLMYGIYEASSAGGMKLEPAAFGGGFPAQVRFSVQKDCIPLPESMFKKAIKDSYDERTHKFRTELTVNQVKHLIDMFRPTPWLNRNGKSNVHEAGPIIHPPTTFPGEEPHKGQGHPNNYGVSDKRDPFFVTEEEYRNYGLRQGSHLSGGDVSNTLVPKLDQELKQLLKSPASTTTSTEKRVHQTDPLFLSEKDYRAFGLRTHQQVPILASPMMATNEIGNVSYNPYDESTDSLVNKYLALPRTTLASHEPYGNYLNQTSEMQNHTRRTIPDGVTAFTSYSLGEQSDFNQRQYSLHEPVAPVSQRYSFAGPFPSEHR